MDCDDGDGNVGEERKGNRNTVHEGAGTDQEKGGEMREAIVIGLVLLVVFFAGYRTGKDTTRESARLELRDSTNVYLYRVMTYDSMMKDILLTKCKY